MNRNIAVKTVGILLALVVLAGALAPDAHARKSRYDKLQKNTPELRDFRIPDVTRAELGNGMVVYLVEDHDLPLIRISSLIRVGGIYEPAAKVGLADLVGEVIRSGGTAANPGDELDVFLESIGASIETGMSDVSGSASMRCLTENLDEVLPLFAEVLLRPAFPQEKLDLAKTQQKTAISRRNDDADQIAWREIFKLYFGANSPYARQSEYDTINAITRNDLVDFHEYFYHPDNIIMVAGGDFDSADMLARLEAAFGDWPAGETFYPPDPVLTETVASVNYIFKEDVNQSKVRMGHLGIKHDDKYLFPLQVLNQILGGGFGSRLFSEVRSKRELAYSVYAWMIVGEHHRMPFIVGVDTKSESTVEAIEVLREEVRKVTVERVSEEELNRAKDGLKNKFVFNFSNPFSIAMKKASYEFYDRDQNYLDTYLEKVNAVTADDVLEAARARIRPDEMAILVVGRADDFDKPLASLGLGEPNEIDIEIPDPSFEEESIPTATEATLAEGRGLMQKALRTHGGGRALKGVKSIEQSGDLTIKETGMGPLTFTIVTRRSGADRLRVDTNTPFGSMVQVIDGDQGWRKSPRGQEALSSGDIAQAHKSERRELVALFQRLDELKVQSLGHGDIEGTECPVVILHEPDGERTKLYLDPGDHRIRAMEYKDEGEMGPVLNLTLLDGEMESGGVRFPKRYRIHHDGKLFATMEMTSVKVNPKLGDELFVEP